MNTPEVRRVGVVGLGSIGRQHARVLKTIPGVELAWVFDSDITAVKSVATSIGCRNISSLSEVAFTDGIIIATPTSTHLQVAAELVGLTDYLLIEKPLAATVKDHQTFEATIQSEFLGIQVGFIERFNPVIEVVKAEIQGQHVRACEFRRVNPASARVTDVDVVTDLMIHDIDLARYLFGEVETITGSICLRNPPYDYAHASLLHDSGVFSFFHTSRVTPSRSREIRILTDEFLITCDLLTRRVEMTTSRGLDDSAVRSYTIRTESRVIEVVPEEPLLRELQTFVELMSGAEPMVPQIIDSKSAILVAEQIVSAAVTSKPTI